MSLLNSPIDNKSHTFHANWKKPSWFRYHENNHEADKILDKNCLAVSVTDILRVFLQWPNGKWKPKNIEKILQDAKLLEILGSGLHRKSLETLKDFRMWLQLFRQLFWQLFWQLLARDVEITAFLLNLRIYSNMQYMLILQKQLISGLLKNSCPEKFWNNYRKISVLESLS